MKIDKINNKTIKITLSGTDMKKFNITYDEMDYCKPETKKAIEGIIKVIKPQISVDPHKNKLFVEAFPNDNGGCYLFVNVIDNKSHETKKSAHSFDTPMIFEFANLDAIADSCVTLQNTYNHIVIKSALFSQKGSYRMLIYTYCKMDNELKDFLSEHSTYVGKGALAAALTMEHYSVVIEDDAIEIICKCLK